MTLRTVVPFTCMFSRIDREELIVMIKLCIPVRSSMAIFTDFRESCSYMVGVGRSDVIIFMTKETIIWRSGVLSVNMAFLTLGRNMSAG